MWPILLDMTEEESIQSLRHLELGAYSSLISALRAQGPLNEQKRKLLNDTGLVLNIGNERHKAEVRRAINDEKLNTIAYHITGQLLSAEDWAQDGRRLVPLLPRTPPQTPYSLIADDVSDDACQYNKQLPLPANTERKRTVASVPGISTVDTCVKQQQTFRIPEVPKEDFKKRKTTSIGADNSSLAQHLLSNKLTKIQQIYRQASKSAKLKHKDQLNKKENKHLTKLNLNPFSHQNKLQRTIPSPTSKISPIQNTNIHSPIDESLITKDNLNKPCNFDLVNENQAPRTYSNSKINSLSSIKQQSTSHNQIIGDSYVKGNSSTVLPTKLVNQGQKLIVVPPKNLPTPNSILQKTLSVPINKLTKLNIEKFKILPNNQLPSTLPSPPNLANMNNSSAKPKLVTLKASSGKKVIPLSQLQMLTSKGNLKMVPYTGKVYEKGTMNYDNVANKKIIGTTSIKNDVDTSIGNVQVNSLKTDKNKEDIIVINGGCDDYEMLQTNFNLEVGTTVNQENQIIDVDQAESDDNEMEINNPQIELSNEFKDTKYSTLID